MDKPRVIYIYLKRSDGSSLVPIKQIKTQLVRKCLIVYRCCCVFPLMCFPTIASCMIRAYKPGMHAGRTAEVRCPFETPRHLETPAASPAPAEEFTASPTLRMVALVLSSFDEIEAPPDKSKYDGGTREAGPPGAGDGFKIRTGVLHRRWRSPAINPVISR